MEEIKDLTFEYSYFKQLYECIKENKSWNTTSEEFKNWFDFLYYFFEKDVEWVKEKIDIIYKHGKNNEEIFNYNVKEAKSKIKEKLKERGNDKFRELDFQEIKNENSDNGKYQEYLKEKLKELIEGYFLDRNEFYKKIGIDITNVTSIRNGINIRTGCFVDIEKYQITVDKWQELKNLNNNIENIKKRIEEKDDRLINSLFLKKLKDIERFKNIRSIQKSMKSLLKESKIMRKSYGVKSEVIEGKDTLNKYLKNEGKAATRIKCDISEGEFIENFIYWSVNGRIKNIYEWIEIYKDIELQDKYIIYEETEDKQKLSSSIKELKCNTILKELLPTNDMVNYIETLHKINKLEKEIDNITNEITNKELQNLLEKYINNKLNKKLFYYAETNVMELRIIYDIKDLLNQEKYRILNENINSTFENLCKLHYPGSAKIMIEDPSDGIIDTSVEDNIAKESVIEILKYLYPIKVYINTLCKIIESNNRKEKDGLEYFTKFREYLRNQSNGVSFGGFQGYLNEKERQLSQEGF
ncbi:MAG: hypothetical protein N4A62_14000 [Marinisporobacter sp.]|nr:hypothetical protein [Marinisporobacter sp.]